MNKVFLQHGPNPIIGNHPAYPRAETAVTPRHHQRKRHSNLHVARFPYSIVIARIGMAKKLIMAAGGILERDGQILLVQRPRYQDWSLPKGKLNRGESPLHAALREVREETGYRAKALGFAGAFGYEVKGAPKVVLYWLMKPLKQGPILDTNEVCEVRWVTVRAALRMMTYELERDLLRRVYSG